MSNGQPLTGNADAGPIDFSKHLIGSHGFGALFEDSVVLVEETAAYLDGPGRADSCYLTRAGALAYAAESMRLTTRLMQLASWLLLQRAVNSGELSAEQAATEKAKVNLGGLSSATDGPGWSDLPEAMRDLVERSMWLQARIRRLDPALGRDPAIPSEQDNPVRRQLGQIAEAFAAH